MAWEAAAVAATRRDSKVQGLAALTAAALALPGVVPTADTEIPALTPEINTNFTRYEESGGRMRVDAYQALGTLAVGDRWNLKANGVKDVVTGASPVGLGLINSPGCKGPSRGALVQCMSSASIHDVRDAVDLGVNYAFDDLDVGVDVGRSSENDYTSNFFNLDGRWDLNQKLTTLAAGYGYASDSVWAIQHVDGMQIKEPGIGGDKSTHQALLGVTQILDKNSLVQANLTYSHGSGFLADPYKFAWVQDTFVRDNRPASREQFGLLLRYAHHFQELNSAALHLDYRLYADTWGISAHTVELSWYQPVIYGWRLTPKLRYYSQNSADFYQPVFSAPRLDSHYSSDYRLAGFGALSGGVQLDKEFFDRLRISGGVEFYERQKAYGISGGAGSALDNFSFAMYSVSLNLKF
jgi:hypothetical protein